MIATGATRYGTVARWLHWGMALLLTWQLVGMILKNVLGRVPLMKFWVGTHPSIGTLLLALLIIRALWAVVEWRNRPPQPQGLVGVSARIGHAMLYLLMFIIPALALLRMIGGGRGVTLFGVQLMPPTGQEIAWMTAPANALHGNLGWLLLVLIIGHVAMVMVHQLVWRDGIFSRMWGKPATARALSPDTP